MMLQCVMMASSTIYCVVVDDTIQHSMMHSVMKCLYNYMPSDITK